MAIEDKVAELGQEFKDFVIKTLKVPWHTLSDTTLRQAIEDFKKSGKRSKIETLLEQLRKELKREYPPHHWNHVNVFSKFWDLYDTVKGEFFRHLD